MPAHAALSAAAAVLLTFVVDIGMQMALCLSPQQRQNCLRLRNAHLHKVRDIMQDRYRINDMMQSTLPSYDFELQAARQHLRALQARPPQADL